MPQSTEVAGIHVSITADIGRLEASLSSARRLLNDWASSARGRQVAITIDAKKGASWDTIENDLNRVIERVTKGNKIPVELQASVPEATLKTLHGNIETWFKANPIDLELTWHWKDGNGPPGDVAVTRGGGGGGGETGGGEAAPQSNVRREAKIPEAKRQGVEAAAPAQATGIAAMSTATPKNRAQRQQEAVIQANTEASEEVRAAAKEWRTVTRQQAMAIRRRDIQGLEPITQRIPTGATGFQAEFGPKGSTGNIRFNTAEGQLISLLRSRRPVTFEGIRPTEGRVGRAGGGDPRDPRRGLADMRSMSWFNPPEGFDPEVTRASKALFDQAMAQREEEVVKSLGDVIQRREGETSEDFRSRLMRDWTFSFMGGPAKARSAKAVKGLSEAFTVPQEVKDLEGLLESGQFADFFGDVQGGQRGALQMRAEALSMIKERQVLLAQGGVEGELPERELKAALSKGTQRARRLRSEGALPEPTRPEEGLYVTLNSLIGQGFARQFFSEQDLRQQQATQQARSTRMEAYREEAGLAYEQERGHPPEDNPVEFMRFWESYKPARRAPLKKGRRTGADVPLSERNIATRDIQTMLDDLLERQEAGEEGLEEQIDQYLSMRADAAASEITDALKGARPTRARLEGLGFPGGVPEGRTARRQTGKTGKTGPWTMFPEVPPAFEQDLMENLSRREAARKARGESIYAGVRRFFPDYPYSYSNKPGPQVAAELEGLKGDRPEEGLPQQVPDVRDIAAALGLGRGGFSSGSRTAMREGSRRRMLATVRKANVEKAFALIGTRYVDEAGRVLNDIREVIELETDPKRTTAGHFEVSKQGTQRLLSRLARTGGTFLGMAHGIPGHGLSMSDLDEQTLQKFHARNPGFLSGIIDPASTEGMRFFGVGAGGRTGRRAMNIATGSINVAPATAQAAMPVEFTRLASRIEADWSDMTDEMRASAVSMFNELGQSMPSVMQQWVNAQAGQAEMTQAEMFAQPPTGQFTAPFRWNMRAAGFGQPMGTLFGGPPPPAAGGGGGGQMGFGGAFGAGFTPFGGGGGAAGGGPPPRNVNLLANLNRGRKAIQQDLFRLGVSNDDIQKVEDAFYDQDEELLAFVREQQSIAAEQLASTPVRALSTAIGQAVAQRFARGEAQARMRRLTGLTRQLTSAGRERREFGEQAVQLRRLIREERETGISARTGEALTPEDIEARQLEFTTARERFQRASGRVRAFQPRVAEAARGVAPISRQVGNLLALAPAIIGGGILFQAGMSLAQAGLEKLGEITGRVVDEMSGFQGTLKQVSDTLAEAALPTGGFRGAVAQQAQTAGIALTPDQRAALAGRAGALVAGQRATLQRDLLRSQAAIREQNARLGPLDAALLQPTGGFLGTFIGAAPPLQETVGNELERLGTQNLRTGGPLFLPGFAERNERLMQEQTDYLDSLNEEIKQGGGTTRFVRGAPAPLGAAFTGGAPQLTQAKLLDELGAPEIAAAVRSGAAAIKDANGEWVLTVDGLRETIRAAGEGFKMPSAQEAFNAMQNEINVAIMGIQQGFENAIQQDIPANFWRQVVTNRALPFGTGIIGPGAGPALGAFGAQAGALQFGQEQRFLQNQQTVLAMPGVNREQVLQLQSIGEEIRNVQADLAGRQALLNLQAYNQQLTVAERNLADIRGLNDQTIAQGASQVGLLERQNLELDRANTLLSRQIQARALIMAQRNINFNLAVAGFSLAGETGAERAARRRQAELEARFAQQDLDAQRQIFQNQGVQFQNQIQIVDEQNLRALKDALFQVRQLKAERDFEQYTRAANEYLGFLQNEAGWLQAQVDEQISRAQQQRNLGQQVTRDIALQTNQILTGTAEQIEDTFRQTRIDFQKWLGDVWPTATLPEIPTRTTRPRDEGQTGGGFQPTAAEGMLGTYNTPTTVTFGEAGSETVAILRNARTKTLNLGGGGPSVTQFAVNISGVTVRDEEDINRIARAVEQVMTQKAGLLGLMRDR